MNPFFAQVNLTVGSMNVTSSEDHLIDMNFVRVSDAVSQSIVFTLYDDSAIALEALLIQGENKLSFSYGYSEGTMSKTYNGLIVKYNVEFAGTGATLVIEAVSDSISDVASPTAYSFRGLRIDEIVAVLASENGWSLGEVVRCRPVLEDDSLPSTPDNYKVFNRENESAQEFILNKLIPYAVSEQGNQGNYIFRIDESSGYRKVYFAPQGWITDTSTDSLTYVMGQDHEKILSFTPEFNDSLIAFIGATGVVGESQNEYTNEYQQVVVSGSSDSELGIVRRIAGSSYNLSQLRALAENVWSKATNMSYPATLVLRGDVSVVPLTNIKVVVLTKDSVMHHSSGTYLINTVEDSIVGGSFQTTLKLIKLVNGQSMVEFFPPYSGGPYTGGYSYSVFVYQRTDGTIQVPSGVPRTSVLDACKRYLGIPYKGGGKTRQSGLDASGLTYNVMQDLSVSISQTAEGQKSQGISIPFDKSNLRPGDLLFWKVASSYSSSQQVDRIIEIALSQKGYHEGANGYTKFGEWFGSPYMKWCAAFVAWCADCAGVSRDVIPKYGAVISYKQFFESKGLYKKKGTYIPKKGDIFIYKESFQGALSHTGFVQYADNKSFTTIEGNWSDAVGSVTKEYSYKHLSGFCTPRYSGVSSNSATVAHVAIYLGNGWVCQSTSNYGSVHFAKLGDKDTAEFVIVRRFTIPSIGSEPPDYII